ncbi:MAG: alginate lyase family protein, partial [Spirochaeta sp.]|nr:alginate lyase family protein [Spirochaeta sp.]
MTPGSPGKGPGVSAGGDTRSDGDTRAPGDRRAGAMYRLGRLIRTVRHLRPRQILLRLLRRGPVARLQRIIFGPPWRRFARRIARPIRTVVDTQGRSGTGGTENDPFAHAPDPPAHLTAAALVVDGVSVSVDPASWGDDAGDSRFRLYRLHSTLFLAHTGTDHAAATAFLDRYIDLLSGDPDAVGPGGERSCAVAWETHPVSLRLISWVRFAGRATAAGTVLPEQFAAALAYQARWLARHIEYETDGNHLVDNAVALILAGWYLGGRVGFRLYLRGLRVFFRELPGQLLPDGRHDERSPMYHRLMTERVLDVVAVTGGDTGGDAYGYARRLLVALRLDGGPEAMTNDAFHGLAPTDDALIAYGGSLGVVPGGEDVAPVISRGPFRVIFDTEAIGPDHVPGHAHADTLQVLLWHREIRMLVDTGTSTYDPGARRDYERSTAAHNTVTVGGEDSSEVWGSFRVGRRARVVSVRTVVDTPASYRVVAVHDGYRRRGVLHNREVEVTPERVVVTDRIVPARRVAPASAAGPPASVVQARAYWHLAPEIAGSLRRISASRVALAGLEVEFRGATKFDIG